MIPTKNRAREHFINPYESQWQTRYYETLFLTMDSKKLKKDVCLNYLEGLEWLLIIIQINVDWIGIISNYPPCFKI